MNITALRNNSTFIIGCILLSICMVGAAPKEEGFLERDIPLVKVIDYFNFDYQFSATIGTFVVEHNEKRLLFILGSNEVFVDGRVIHLNRPVMLRDGQIVIRPDGVDLITRELLGRTPHWSYEGEIFTVREKRSAASGLDRRSSSPMKGTASASTETRHTPIVRADKRLRPTRSAGYEIRVIVIDAGHGGKDPGGIGYNNIQEKSIVLGVAKELKRELRKRFRDKEIVMIRKDDSFISLEERGEIANSIDPEKNPIFVSIHANVAFTSSTSGYESYFLSLDPFGEKARDVAMRENSVLNFEVENYNDYLKEIINRIVDIEYRRESRLLAGYIQDGLQKKVSNESQNRGVKSAFFYVLKSSKMPAVLVEIGFVTNKPEALRLLQLDYQRKLARGISDGIEDFINTFRKSNGFTQSYAF